MFSPDLLAGQRILITGGGTGLGRMMAEYLMAHGAAVEIWGRRAPVLEETAAEVHQLYIEATDHVIQKNRWADLCIHPDHVPLIRQSGRR